MSSKSSKSLDSKGKGKSSNEQKTTSQTRKFKSPKDPDVLLELPAGLKYKVPGKRQRVIIGSIVIGLNVLLVISVLVYFYNPSFQDFVYNFGRS